MEDLVRLAVRGVLNRSLRSAITIVGIIIGISAVILLVSVSKGFQSSVEQLFEEFGADTIMIVGGSGLFTSSLFAPIPLTDKDVETVERVNGVKYAAGVAAKTLPISYRGEETAVVVYGMEPKALETLFGKFYENYMEEGRTYQRDNVREAILGYSVAHDLFSEEIRVGRSIEIKGVKFKVVGVLRRAGDPQDDLSITIPLNTFNELVEEEISYPFIVAKVSKGADIQKVAEDIKKRLKETRGREDFTVQTSEDLLNQINNILNVITLIVMAIAIVSIFVGGVGIMNTMYMSVTERTREIGVMKAVGATKGQIMAVFLLEAGLIGMIGGVVGEGIAVAMAKLVEGAVRNGLGIQYYSVYLGPELLVGAVLFSFLVGIISGFLPAKRAADMDPVEALRYE